MPTPRRENYNNRYYESTHNRYFHWLQGQSKVIENNTKKPGDPEYTCCGYLIDDETRSTGVCPLCLTPANTDGTYDEPKGY